MFVSKKSTVLLTIAMLGAGQNVLAHTTVQTNPNPEGTTVYNNLAIGHGCTMPDGTHLPVIAESVIWPTVNPIVTTTPTTTVADWSKVFSVTTLAGNPKLVRSRDVFNNQSSKVDANGNVIGFTSTHGSLEYGTAANGTTAYGAVGLIPFRTAGIKFGAAGCATSLTVNLAVADYCQADGAVNVWIPTFTTKFTASNVTNPADVPDPSPAKLVYNRDLTANPLPASCGTGFTVTVTPSAADIDANLPIPASAF